MCTSFTRDLPSELLTRLEALLHPPYLVSESPQRPSLGLYGRKHQNNFHLFMSGKQFRPSETEVKLEDGSVVVEAKHEDDLTPSEFKRSYKLPDGIDPATFNFAFNEKGLLVITTSKKSEVVAKPAPTPLDTVAANVPEQTQDEKVVTVEAGSVGEKKVD